MEEAPYRPNEVSVMRMPGQEELSCGLGRWRPRFLQKFATLRYFLIVYGLLGTVQAMSFVYFIATLTTLEKRFQIRSEVTGILMTGNEMSQILLSIVLAYHGGKGNRPLWIAWGVLFSSLSCFILATPHFFYGAGANALALTHEYLDYRILNSTATPTKDPLLCNANRTEENQNCREENMEKSLLSLCLIFFSQVVLGVGTTLYVTLGQPYLDDNSKKTKTPMLLGLTLALRTAGPAVGFVLAFLCLNLYIDPSLDPIIERSDPRWLGAWWLGWVILGTIMTVFSLLIASFPRQLHREGKTKREGGLHESVVSDGGKAVPETRIAEFEMPLMKNHRPGKDDVGVFTDFKNALKRVCGNSLLVCNTFTTVFYILGASGYINFYAKYSETQFHQSAASSSMIAGVTTVVAIAVGLLSSGFIITKFKPEEPKLLLFNAFIPVIHMAGQLIFMFLGCDKDTLQGEFTQAGMYNPNSSCNANCSCQLINYSPVCFERGNQTFFSACHAGCTQIQDATQRSFTNCACLPEPSDVVKQGPCKVNCTLNFIIFVAVQALTHMIGCSGRITSILITYRCVRQRDKPLAQGFTLLMVSLVAFIPGPIIFGRVIDSTCMIWDYKCGKRGNCWVYDNKATRTYLNATALGFTFVALLFDIAVYFLGKNIKLYEEISVIDRSYARGRRESPGPSAGRAIILESTKV